MSGSDSLLSFSAADPDLTLDTLGYTEFIEVGFEVNVTPFAPLSTHNPALFADRPTPPSRTIQQVGFAEQVYISGLEIGENVGMGSITGIKARPAKDATAPWQPLYRGLADTG